VPPPLPDLSITRIEPIQVVPRPDINGDGEIDLVLRKPTAVFVDIHVENPTFLVDPTFVDLHFQGVTYTKGFQPTDVDPSGKLTLVFSVLPTQRGIGQSMSATVDPQNTIRESNEANNTYPLPPLPPVLVSVRRVSPLRIDYVVLTKLSRCVTPILSPCYGAIDLRAANESLNQSRSFLEATYPVPTVSGRFVGTIEGSPVRFTGRERDLDAAWSLALKTDPSVERVVLLVPSGYFAFHFRPFVGESFPDKNAVLATVNYWMTPAHEVGHTFGLHKPTLWPGLGEEYETTNPVGLRGNCASGYWVQRSVPIGDGICFMSSVPITASRTFTFQTSCEVSPGSVGKDVDRHSWIDSEDYKALFLRLSAR